MLCKERGTPLIRALLLTFSHVGIYFAHSTVLLTAVEICKETRVFQSLICWPITDYQFWIRKLLCRTLKNWALQVHAAKDNSILGDAKSAATPVSHNAPDPLKRDNVCHNCRTKLIQTPLFYQS